MDHHGQGEHGLRVRGDRQVVLGGDIPRRQGTVDDALILRKGQHASMELGGTASHQRPSFADPVFVSRDHAIGSSGQASRAMGGRAERRV